MAVIEAALRALVLADVTVSGTIGTRLYPLETPASGSLPAIVYRRISGPEDYSQDGESGLRRPRFQWDCQARTYAAANALAYALRDAISGYTGTTSGVEIDGIFVENVLDAYRMGEA